MGFGHWSILEGSRNPFMAAEHRATVCAASRKAPGGPYERSERAAVGRMLCLLLLLSVLPVDLCSPAQPHIVFLLADDMGWDDVSFHGSSQIPTPNLDTLAADGVILNGLYAQSSCTPSRAALMTGRYPIRTGMQGIPLQLSEPWGLPLDVRILPQYLKDLGYETHLVGKWHLGAYMETLTPTFRGFDSFYGFYSGEEDYYSHKATYANYTGLDFWLNTEPRWVDNGTYSTTLYTQRAQYLILNRQKEKPLFLLMSYQAPHGTGGDMLPLQAPQENTDKFSYIGEQSRIIFAGMMDALDQSVGEVFQTLNEAGMLENTVVIFSSDNGGTPFGSHSSRSFNWPLRGTKMSVWEGSTRVPAFVWSPLLARRRRVSHQLMHFTDWLPTLYKIAGGDVASLEDMDGLDMWRHLSTGAPSPRTEMLYNIHSVGPESSVAAVRTSQYKLVLEKTAANSGRYATAGGRRPHDDLDQLLAQSTTATVLRDLYKTDSLRFPRGWRQRATLTCGQNIRENFAPGDGVFLFDIIKDPCELNNLADSLPEVVSALKKRIYAYRVIAVPVRNKPSDPASFPDKHNGTWAPWVKPSYSGAVGGTMVCPTLLVLVLPVVLCSSAHPHIVYLLADDMGWDDVSFHGSSQIPTPNLDALAADGVILNSLYAQPSCSPSREALMSGRYPIRTGLHGLPIQASEPWGLPLDVRILPQYLQELGYETHLVGKWHLGAFMETLTPTFRGFNSFYGFYNGEEDYYTHSATFANHTGLDFWLNTEPRWEDKGIYSTTLYTQRAQYLIRHRQKEKPLFLFLSYQAPHGTEGPIPLEAPQENIDKFPYIGEESRTIFAGMLDAMDQSIGEVFQTLGEAGMLNSTVVIFSSDNGGTPFGSHSSRSFNWPLRGTKMSVWEGSTRVPAFVWSPLLTRRRRVSHQLMHFTDWLPTLYKIAGGDVASLGDVDGLDMWEHLSTGAPSPRTEMLYNTDTLDPKSTVTAIRNSRYKLVLDRTEEDNGRYPTAGGRRPHNDLDRLLVQSTAAAVLRDLYKTDRLRFPRSWRRRATLTCGRSIGKNFSPDDAVFLFDIIKDPCELNNLAESLPEVVSDLMRRIDAYRAEAVPMGNKPSDPAAFPELHNGTWAPWVTPS
ncbi:uncharacterized protein LOC144124306 [Amblyomma americanum]